jgi:hypothetical protein
MYRLHIAIADLVPPAADEHPELPRLPVLESLLSRAQVSASCRDWRTWALRRLGARVAGERPALGRLLATRQGLAVDDRTWFALAPVHLVAGLATVNYHAAGPVVLDEATAWQTAAALANDFPDPELEFRAVGTIVLLGVRGAMAVATEDPSLLAGQDLALGAARGADARRLARWGGEFELWLHARGLRGVDGRRVNAFHPWGEGTSDVVPAERSPRLLGSDPFLRAALGPETETAAALDVWSVTDLLTAGHGFGDVDRQWAVPLRSRLADGEVLSADIHAAGRVYTVTSRQRWRVYRRVRPWWECLA